MSFHWKALNTYRHHHLQLPFIKLVPSVLNSKFASSSLHTGVPRRPFNSSSYRRIHNFSRQYQKRPSSPLSAMDISNHTFNGQNHAGQTTRQPSNHAIVEQTTPSNTTEPLPILTLDPVEQKIRDLLVKFAKVFEKTHATESTSLSEPVVLRITGGWVRDKLLGRTSHDIDIAINTSTGLVFAEALNKYITEHAEELSLEPHSIHKIEKNPEKSKHLETATTKLYGLDIDFVNLRAEEYANESSRIPSNVRFGTPQDDALRRDATLNALFYNLQESKVEDFTGKGLTDLKNGILRTPLEPYTTFYEDPLRVLRLIRFSSTFGFQIADSALDAMRNPKIHEAIIIKISRERVGIEISKILNSSMPAKGLNTIADLGLEDSVFLLLDAYKPNRSFRIPSSRLKEAVSIVDQIVRSSTLSSLHAELQPIVNSPIIWLCAALNHWGTVEALDEKKKPASAVRLIIRDGLKLSISEAKFVSEIFALEEETREIASKYNELTRKELGRFIRRCGQQWRLHLVYSLVKELMNSKTDDENVVNGTITKYSKLVEKILTLNLSDAWNLKPLINGKQIQQAWGIAKGGPWLSRAIDDVIEYQLANPGLTEHECLEYVKSIKNNFA